ncbi:TIGR03086 family metal-binding protein [Kutzneria sp. CA-103260]|uniref:TIGR03086 family metal-binding protein n=1 Tax=Kutzneria sp. CA-103260 TaxID=2802641 RepID=UPI001BA45758|nr:TIGR03086 family metal-binding protein [Kutzneria sp. CA-103260]QUQ70520.1 Activator of Hsp90 ATPase -like protein [Kutzneria sp. CA-103260]
MSVDVSVSVSTSADEAYAWLTEPARLRQWQLIAGRTDLRVGGEFRWLVAPTHTAVGTVTAAEPGRRLALAWGWEGDKEVPPGSSTVDVTIEPAADGVTVRLVHQGLSDEQAKGHHEGWQHFLQRLRAVTTTGDAGPDEFSALSEPEPLAAAEASLAVCLRVLRTLGADHGSAQTPCKEFTVDDLLGHLMGSLDGLTSAAGGSFEAVDGTPEERVADGGLRAIEAWRARGLDGDVRLAGIDLPAELAAGILSIEFLVHAWDFAAAAGVDVTADDKLSAYVLELSRKIIAPELRDGVTFAAEVRVGPDAGTLERLIAFTGRAA